MDAIIDGAISEPEWLEKETDFWGFRVWHLMFFCFSGVLSVSKFHSRNNMVLSSCRER